MSQSPSFIAGLSARVGKQRRNDRDAAMIDHAWHQKSKQMFYKCLNPMVSRQTPNAPMLPVLTVYISLQSKCLTP